VESCESAGKVEVTFRPAVSVLERYSMLLVAVLLDEAHQQLTVELLRPHILERLEVAPLPMLHQIAEQLRAPADAAFEEGEAQFREAPGDTAEEDALGGGMAGIGEMADMVVGEVGRRIAQRLVAAGAVEGRRDADFAAFLPHRVVVVDAVDAEHLIPDRETVGVGMPLRDRIRLARHRATEHANLGAELLGDEFEL